MAHQHQHHQHHDDDHQHDHEHGHRHGPHHGHRHDHHHGDFNRAFAIGVVLNIIFVIAEWIGGWWANSLALLADAGHNLSDVLGLLLAWAAHWATSAAPSQKRTYGWKSSSIIAALFNAQILLVAIGGIVWEAVGRLTHPAASNGVVIIALAAMGVMINGFTAMLFMSGQKSDLNVRGAYLHMAADAAVSLGVVVAGSIILMTGVSWVDPVASIIVAVVILMGTWSLLRESLDLAMHAVPRHIDMAKVRQLLEQLPDVIAVHDLHVWAMSTTETALTVHLVKADTGDNDGLLQEAAEQLQHRFGISHATLQIEGESAAKLCRLAPDHVV